jgi:3-oxoacyl-[acyl-carrier-protein] synthase-1
MSYILSHNIINSIGFTSEEVADNIEKGITGITDKAAFAHLTEAPVALIDKIAFSDKSILKNANEFTFFEQLAINSIIRALQETNVKLSDSKTLLIISTTKGNIELLEKEDNPIDGLVASAAENIARYFACANSPQVVCNACISGVLAMIIAHRYIMTGSYENVIVCGVDIVSDFVVAGFESFKSMSPEPCKPFDAKRVGLSLGEGAGTVVFSRSATNQPNAIKVVGGSSANDANHISGPSRTGEGAYLSAKKALNGNHNIDFISAHGTATPYNDDMESVALNRLELKAVPVNSFKGYFGHTLGAAGTVESILTILSMQKNRIYKTLGLEEKGTVQEINTTVEHIDMPINRALKISSGFGGCNAAIVFEKDA